MTDIGQCSMCGAPIWTGFNMCPACGAKGEIEVGEEDLGEDALYVLTGKALHERDEEIIRLKLALTLIEGGILSDASTMVLEGRWQDMVVALQEIARDALKE